MSTLWFARHCAHVIAVEHNPQWYKRVRGSLEHSPNAVLELRTDAASYLAEIDRYPMKYFDIVAIDGIQRRACVEAALEHLKPEGFLVLDNSDAPEYRDADEFVQRTFPQRALRIFRGFPAGSFHPTETTIAQVTPEVAESRSSRVRPIHHDRPV